MTKECVVQDAATEQVYEMCPTCDRKVSVDMHKTEAAAYGKCTFCGTVVVLKPHESGANSK